MYNDKCWSTEMHTLKCGMIGFVCSVPPFTPDACGAGMFEVMILAFLLCSQKCEGWWLSSLYTGDRIIPALSLSWQHVVPLEHMEGLLPSTDGPA